MKFQQLIKNVVVAFCVTALWACIEEEDAVQGDIVHIGDSLPDFAVTLNDGSIVSDDSLLGRASFVVFFHTSCPDCQSVLPRLQRLYDGFPADSVTFVLISRAEPASSVSSFWESANLTMPYSSQPDRAVYELFAKSSIPRVYISDEQGIIRTIFTDNPVPSYEDLLAALKSVL